MKTLWSHGEPCRTLQPSCKSRGSRAQPHGTRARSAWETQRLCESLVRAQGTAHGPAGLVQSPAEPSGDSCEAARSLVEDVVVAGAVEEADAGL